MSRVIPVQYGDWGGGGRAHGSERACCVLCAAGSGRVATSYSISFVVFIISSLPVRVSRSREPPTDLLRPCEPPAGLRLGKREAGLAPCHLAHLALPPRHLVCWTWPSVSRGACLRLVMAARATKGAHIQDQDRTGQGTGLLSRQVPRFLFLGGTGRSSTAGLDRAPTPALSTIRSLFGRGGGVQEALRGGSLHRN